MADRALLVVDMLVDFVDPQGALYIGEAAPGVVSQLEPALTAARARAEPVIYLCDRHRPDDPEFDLFPPHAVAGTRGAEIHPALAPAPDDHVIAKRRFSGFFGTELDLLLRELGQPELVIAGVCTNICVLYTAADARARGYRVTVPRAQTASFDAEAHRFALKELEATLGCRVV